jgi:zinc protease
MRGDSATTCGVPEVVEGFGEDQVRDWAGRVRATRPVAVVVGDVDVRDVTAELGALTRWEVDGDGEHPQAAVPVWRPSRAVEERDKQQTALALAFPAAPYRSPDRFPLRVVGTLLSGLAGRLFDELREKRSLAYTVAAMPWVVREAGAVLCYIATSPEREGEAREAMLAELERLSAEPPNDEELARARAYAAGLVEIGAQSGRSVAGRVLDAWVNDDIAHWADAPERLREVSRDEVARVAASVFQASQAVECVVRGAPMGTEE